MEKVFLGNREVNLEVLDIAFQDEFSRLRPLVYINAGVVLLCFSLVDQASFERVRTRASCFTV